MCFSPSNRCRRFGRPGLILAAFMTLSPSGAHAVTRTWVSPVSGSASTNSNWTPALAPSASDKAVFDDPGAYTVTWTSPQDTLQNLSCNFGTPTFSISSILGVRDVFSVLQSGQAEVTNGILRANQVLIGVSNLARLRVSSGFLAPGQVVSMSPNTPAMLADTNSATARVYVLSGGRLLSNSTWEVGRGSAASCSLVVSGTRHILNSTYRSTFGTLTNSGGGTRGDVIFGTKGGATEHTYVNITDGGLLDVKGSLYVGVAAWGILRLYETTPNTNPRIDVLKNIGIGYDPTSGQLGTGDIIISAGTASLGGNLLIGDPDHVGAGRGTLLLEGGTMVVGGSIKMPSAQVGSLQLAGGTLRVLSGTSEIYQLAPFNVSSSIGSPSLIVNGSSDFRVHPGNGSPVALGIGRGGAGRVRVCGYGTRIEAWGPTMIADSLGGTGICEADSGSFFNSDDLIIGPGGQLSIKNDSYVALTSNPRRRSRRAARS